VERLGFWKDLVRQGLKTPVEAPGDTRSDCHAWGSHPLFHLFASVAGIGPASPGFRSVEVAPQPGRYRHIAARLPHPDGEIAVNLRFDKGTCRGEVQLPEGIRGRLKWAGRSTPLAPGSNAFDTLP